MRTLRLTVAGMVLLALLGGGAVAQDDPDDFLTATAVTGKTTGYESIKFGALVYEGLLDEQYRLEVAWSDPRLPSSARVRENAFMYRTEDERWAMSHAGTVRLDGPDGTWVGTTRGHGLEVPGEDGERHGTSVLVLEGQDAYEGLHAVLTGRLDQARSKETGTFETPGYAAYTYDGFIFEGEVPPFPEPAD